MTSSNFESPLRILRYDVGQNVVFPVIDENRTTRIDGIDFASDPEHSARTVRAETDFGTVLQAGKSRRPGKVRTSDREINRQFDRIV